jgi:hypothetical protein
MNMDDIDIRSMDAGGDEPTRRAAATPSFSSVELLDASTSTPHTMLAGSVKQQPLPRAAPRKGIWRVMSDQVPTLPELHPLERTAVFIPNDDPSAISERISGELRDRSIEAFYDDDIAKAKCNTADGVDFRIRMYRGRGKYDHGTIVEVQRRFGMSTNFHSDTMAILDRAKGKDVPRSFQKSSLPLVSDTDDDYQASGSSSLAMVAKMLKPPGYDSQYLGLQTLSSLTDSVKMGSSTAIIISKELLRPENEVGSKVMSLILDTKGEDEMFKLRTLAMTCLANALHAVRGDISSMLSEQLEPVLLKDLSNAEKNQRVAVQAARCVEWLLAQDKQSIPDYEEALKIALEVGSARHAGLERQTKKCLNKIL